MESPIPEAAALCGRQVLRSKCERIVEGQTDIPRSLSVKNFPLLQTLCWAQYRRDSSFLGPMAED